MQRVAPPMILLFVHTHSLSLSLSLSLLLLYIAGGGVLSAIISESSPAGTRAMGVDEEAFFRPEDRAGSQADYRMNESMRWLLGSSWRKFGHAGRGSYDWQPGLTLLETQLQSEEQQVINSTKEDAEPFLYIILPTAALLVIGFFFLFLYRRCKTTTPQGQIFAIGLQENQAERDGDFFSALSWGSEPYQYSTLIPEASMLTICLPPTYEEAITKASCNASIRIVQEPVPPYEDNTDKSNGTATVNHNRTS